MELSEDEKKMIAAFRELHTIPKVESAADLVHYMRHFGDEPETKLLSHQVPRLSIFYGETGKGEVSFQTWKYELRCLLKEKFHSEEAILQGIRRSCKGEAADLLRRTGEGAKVSDIIHVFESTFGVIETQESIMKKLYDCCQQPGETITSYTSRIEELFLKAVEMDAIHGTEGKKKLKSILYQGLTPDLKQWAKFEYQTIEDFEEFKIALRRIENDINTNKQSTTKTKCNSLNKKEDKETSSDTTKELLEKMNAKIDKIEQEVKQQQFTINQQVQAQQTQGFSHGSNYNYGTPQQNHQQFGNNYYQPRQQNYQSRFRGAIRNRGPRHYRYLNDGRGSRPMRGLRSGVGYTPNRPMSYNNFQPQCYNCRGRGHLARNCPSLNL